MIFKLPGSCQHVNLDQVVTFYHNGTVVSLHLSSNVTVQFKVKDDKTAAAIVDGLAGYFGGAVDLLAAPAPAPVPQGMVQKAIDRIFERKN